MIAHLTNFRTFFGTCIYFLPETACYCIQSGSSTLSNITKFGCFCKNWSWRESGAFHSSNCLWKSCEQYEGQMTGKLFASFITKKFDSFCQHCQSTGESYFYRMATPAKIQMKHELPWRRLVQDYSVYHPQSY